jgi:hypothetical protein
MLNIRRFTRWFIVSGGVGAVVAVALYAAGSMR